MWIVGTRTCYTAHVSQVLFPRMRNWVRNTVYDLEEQLFCGCSSYSVELWEFQHEYKHIEWLFKESVWCVWLVLCRYVFDYHPGDVYWCTADIGWITGHSYITYGPLANGATSVLVCFDWHGSLWVSGYSNKEQASLKGGVSPIILQLQFFLPLKVPMFWAIVSIQSIDCLLAS